MDQFKFVEEHRPDQMRYAEEDIAHQTLVKRSKRILGENVELGQATPKDGTSETHTPSGSSPAPNKRREQVRQAQRTHRQRTQTYMKTLEKEVLRLRNAETDSMAKIEKLQRQVDSLLAVLVENNIQIPSGIMDEALLHSSLSLPDDHKGKRTIVLNPRDDSSLVGLELPSGSGGISSSSSIIEEAKARTAAIEPLPPLGDEECPPPSLVPRVVNFNEGEQPSILNNPQVGIDFVLALERPCLPHLRDSHLDHIVESKEGSLHSHNVSGHVYTASLSLWQPTDPSRTNSETYKVSATELSRLLQSSLNIPIDSDEITPIQIWHHLKSVSLPSDLHIDNLGRLAEELVKYVECLHFGAIVKIENVRMVLGDLFPECRGMGEIISPLP